jgi:hypothetical protein
MAMTLLSYLHSALGCFPGMLVDLVERCLTGKPNSCAKFNDVTPRPMQSIDSP